MAGNLPYSNSSDQPQRTSASGDTSWRDTVENATRALDPDVYSDRNTYARYPPHPLTVSSQSLTAPGSLGSQQGLSPAYHPGSQLGSPASHAAAYPPGSIPVYPQNVGLAQMDPYGLPSSYSRSGRGTPVPGGSSTTSHPQYPPHSSNYLPQSYSALRGVYAPFPPPGPAAEGGSSGRLSSTPFDHSTQALTVDGKPRERVFIACGYCRRRKFKCDGARPCTTCQRHGEECVYDSLPTRRGPDKEPRIRSPAGVQRPRRTGSRKDGRDDPDYEHDGTGARPSGQT